MARVLLLVAACAILHPCVVLATGCPFAHMVDPNDADDHPHGSVRPIGMDRVRISAEASEVEKGTALGRLNKLFRSQYASTKEQLFLRDNREYYPFLVCAGSSFTLYISPNVTKTFKASTELYHPLKMVDHAILAIFVTLFPLIGEKISEHPVCTEVLPEAYAEMNNARRELQASFPSSALRSRQDFILGEGQYFIRVVCARDGGPLGRYTLQKFTRDMASKMLANAQDAAVDQLNSTHTHMLGYKKELEQMGLWDSLKVVVLGGHMPKKGELHRQYFQKLLGVEGEPRLMYGENLSFVDKTAPVNMLMTHIVDGEAGAFFFDDYSRMHRDVLADATTDYLHKLFPDSPL